MTPAWLANVEVELALSRQDRDDWLMSPEMFQLGLLDWLSVRVNPWLDTTRVHGHPEAQSLVERIYRCYLSVAWFTHLRGQENGALTRIVDTCVRLNGLRLTPDTQRQPCR